MTEQQKVALEAVLRAAKVWWKNSEQAQEQPLLDALVAALVTGFGTFSE